MDDPVNLPGGPEGVGDAAVVWANHFQFAPGEVITNRDVESRTLICGHRGSGFIESEGCTIDMRPAAWVLLPWRHTVTYRADEHDAFMVIAVHIIPWHDWAAGIELRAAHGRRDELAGVAYRRDVDWPAFRGVVHGATRSDSRLLTLARLAVDHIQEGSPDVASARSLAVLILNELHAALAGTDRRGGHGKEPPALIRMQAYITDHLRQPLSNDEIASVGGVSVSTAQRLFRRRCGQAIAQWVAAQRMSMAREMLRTTSLSVAQVARAVGFEDASYFSRAFRRHHGIPPSTYAARSGRLL